MKSKKYIPNGVSSSSCRSSIDILSIDYDVPLNLAKCLIGHSEPETEDNIGMFIDYLRSVIQKYNDPAIAWEQRRNAD